MKQKKKGGKPPKKAGWAKKKPRKSSINTSPAHRKAGGASYAVRGSGAYHETVRGRTIAQREREADGVLSGTRQGYGFVRVEGMTEDVFIPAGQMGHALHGDRVRIRYEKEADGRFSGRVAEILSFGRETLTGTLASERIIRRGRRMSARHVRYFVLPDDPRFGEELEVKNDGFSEGDKVLVRLSRRPGRPMTGTVTESFGRAGTKDAGYLSILHETGIRTEFSKDVLDEAAACASEPLQKDGRYRPTEPVLTIDGADAKDLDDAVSLIRLDDGRWQLGVHIADVSHYVGENSAVEREAFLRGTSVYFTDKVVPMLPEALSNGACSLNAGEDKYALSAYMTLSPDGGLLSTVLHASLIRSSVRGVYSEVNDLFEKGEASEYYEKYKNVNDTLQNMRILYRLLADRAKERGSIEFESAEARILLNEAGEPVDILPRTRGDAEKLIEQFMLCANTGVATLLTKKKLPCVYRVHEAPDPEKLASLRAFCKSIGLDTRVLPKEKPQPRELDKLLSEAREKGLLLPVSYMMLRSMQKAKYSAETHGHYGLSIELYCHFTSPIRRLSDLATHRILHKLLLDGGKRGAKAAVSPATVAHYKSYADRASSMATEGEMRALTAERQIDALYKTIYMSRFIGKEMTAVISSVTSFGIFATLPNTCEGLILLSESEDRLIYDEARCLLVGAQATYRLGDAIRVRVTDTDMTMHRVYFTLLGKEAAPEAP